MKILVPRLSGFCPGVRHAEKLILKQIKDNPKKNYSVLGMMINNRKYINFLDSIGVKTIENWQEAKIGSVLFIRTHGIDKTIQKKIEKTFKIIDLTCKNVKNVQETIKKHNENNAAIFITGKKNHPEVLGLKSYAKKAIVFENEENIDNFLKNPQINNERFSPENFSELFITSQTTGNKNLFESSIKKLKQRWPESVINKYNSICSITEKKEKEALLLQEKADISFVIGDPLSSNANKLFNILKNSCSNTLFIQDLYELKKHNIDYTNKKIALVVSSASTPYFIENKIVNYLEKI